METQAKELQKVLQQLLQERGMENVVREASVPQLWNELIGENAARHCAIQSFENKELKVVVDSSVWRSELKLRRIDLIQKLNERLGVDLVSEITFR